MFTGIVGLFALGLIVVIVTQFVKKGSSGPNVISNLFANISGYINLIK